MPQISTLPLAFICWYTFFWLMVIMYSLPSTEFPDTSIRKDIYYREKELVSEVVLCNSAKVFNMEETDVRRASTI